jgi:hypothetical protein
VHHPIAAGQLAQQSPTQGMPRQPQKPWRRQISLDLRGTHVSKLHQTG